MADVARTDAQLDELTELQIRADGLTIDAQPAPAAAAAPGRSVVGHAKLIGIITFVSRIVGLLREMVALRSFGDTGVWAAWGVAFSVPNLFRKLLGEGALSAAFVPLYAKALHRDDAEAKAFASATVNLLSVVLIVLTLLGEALLIGLLWRFDFSPNNRLVLQFSTIMLPYVTLVCLTAFLGAILQVHHRFTAFSFTAVVLNVILIFIIVVIAKKFDLTVETQRERGAIWLSFGVLAAGMGQMALLLPSLKATGFRIHLTLNCWTPAVRKLVLLTLPLAGGAGVLQIGTMLDKGIAQVLAKQATQTHFTIAGHTIRYPILEGAAARLNDAQFMYQFPLGVFAIALATAIFPMLSREALHPESEGFKRILRQGLDGSLFIGLPSSVGMILVARPAIHLLFEGGRFNFNSAEWMALSTAIYSAAIWAFSMLQIINRGFYSLHDARTPLRWTAINLLINLVVELPLLWTSLGESGMAVGTLVSFSIQAVAMLAILDRRVGGMRLHLVLPNIARMVGASIIMLCVCLLMQRLPIYPHGTTKLAWAGQLGALVIVGGVVYFAACAVMGLDVMHHLPIRRRRKARASTA